MEIQRIIRYALSLLLTLAFLLHVGNIVHIPILTSLENQAYDARLKITLPENVDKQVVIVDIDEKSLDKIGQWPWNRNILARINDDLFYLSNIFTAAPSTIERYESQAIAVTVCRMDAAFERTGMCLQRVSAILAIHVSDAMKAGSDQVELQFQLAVHKVNRTAVKYFKKRLAALTRL